MTDIDLAAVHAGVVKLYDQGYSCKDICSEFGLSVSSVRKILKEAGFNTRSYRKASDDVTDKVLLLIKTGYPYNKIEQLLHISTHLVREIVSNNGYTGFAPKFHHPIKLEIKETDISDDILLSLRELYFSGRYGLIQCSAVSGASDQDFLWFVFHLTDAEKKIHGDYIRRNIKEMFLDGIPVSAIAKRMHISPSIVKKVVKALD